MILSWPILYFGVDSRSIFIKMNRHFNLKLLELQNRKRTEIIVIIKSNKVNCVSITGMCDHGSIKISRLKISNSTAKKKN